MTHVWVGREHRMRMFAIFMNPNLIHFNDSEITDDERDHSRSYHMYLGPIDCTPTKSASLPDAEDIRKILPVHIQEDDEEFAALLDQEEEDRLEDALASISISEYFRCDSESFKAFGRSDKASSTAAKSLQAAPAPSERFSKWNLFMRL